MVTTNTDCFAVFLIGTIALLVAVLIVSAVIVGPAWLWNRRSEKLREVRGFEVKQTTGIEPVMQKKENDHG